MRKKLNETEQKEYNDLLGLLGTLWKRDYLASYSLSYGFTKKDIVYYCLYVFKYSLTDGERHYTKPTKYYKNYNNMKSKIIYITENGLT